MKYEVFTVLHTVVRAHYTSDSRLFRLALTERLVCMCDVRSAIIKISGKQTTTVEYWHHSFMDTPSDYNAYSRSCSIREYR